MAERKHLVCLTFDFDTVSLWLAQGRTSPTFISRGEFGVVGAERLLSLFDRLGIATTWFILGSRSTPIRKLAVPSPRRGTRSVTTATIT